MQAAEHRLDYKQIPDVSSQKFCRWFSLLKSCPVTLGFLPKRYVCTAMLAGLVHLVVVLGAVSAEQAPSAEAHANKATELVQAGNLREAEAELRSAVGLAPGDASYLASLGTVLAMQRKFEESTIVFKQALKIVPSDATTRRYLAANLWQLHRYPEAKENLEILLKQSPGDKPARLLLGMVAENLKDYRKAAEMLSSVPEEVKQQPESILALARSYYHLGRTAEAQTTLAELGHLSVRPDVIVLGAQIADEGQDYVTAERMLSSIRASSPDLPEVGYRIALVQYHAQRFAESQHTLLDLIDRHPSSKLYNLLGWCYYKQDQSGKARQSLERAIELAPSEEPNYLDLGNLLVADHSLPAALELAKRMTVALPSAARAFELRGLVEMKMSQFSDALVSYARALQLDSSSPEALLGLAQVQFAAGMKKEGASSFETALKQFPRDPRFKVQYAAILLKEAETGDASAETRAENLLKSVLVSNPSVADAHYELGNLAMRKRHIPEAVRHLEEAEKLAPQSSEIHFALSRAYRRLGRKDKASQEEELYRKLSKVPEAGATSSDSVDLRK
jgi:tetratricopeptide (TPR) repeat protein